MAADRDSTAARASGPTIYGHVQEDRVVELEAAAAEFRKAVEYAVRTTSVGYMERALREAYRRGVVDGFAQGIAHGEARRDA